MPNTSHLNHEHVRADESQAFWTIFAIGFLIFFALAVLASLLGINWRSHFPGAESAKGLVGGVKAAVYTFMSHIT